MTNHEQLKPCAQALVRLQIAWTKRDSGEALAAFEIIYILRAGMLLEDYVANRSRRAIRKMLEVSVKDALSLIHI